MLATCIPLFLGLGILFSFFGSFIFFWFYQFFFVSIYKTFFGYLGAFFSYKPIMIFLLVGKKIVLIKSVFVKLKHFNQECSTILFELIYIYVYISVRIGI